MSIVGQHHREHHEQEDLLRERLLEARAELADLKTKYAILLESRDHWMTAFESRAGGPC